MNHIGCRFCYPPDAERIIYKGNHHYVLISLGQIVEGYLLIVSKTHTSCCAEIADYAAEEFDWLTQEVEKILQSIYGQCIFYEHGKIGSCSTEAGEHTHCYHAHMHCVPVLFDIDSIVEKDFQATRVNGWPDFRQKGRDLNSEYLFTKGPAPSIFKPSHSIRKQYLRHKVAETLQTPEFADWVSFPFWERILKARERLLPAFSNL